MDPVDAFLKWFDGQPGEIQVALAFFVMLPALMDSLGELEELPGQLRSWVQADRESPISSVGRLLCLRALVDFHCLRQRGTREAWRDARAINEGLRAFALQSDKPEMAKMPESFLKEEPLRSGRWIRSMDTWRELCQTTLSDSALDNWIDSNPPNVDFT